MNNNFTKKLKILSKSAGVYLFRDERGKVIYVGKAVNLKNRVSSYFNQAEKDPKTTEMISRISNLDTIGCGSEFEALILESELVKRYKPKYNVRLKDDKSYVYVKITNEDYPKVTITRRSDDEKARYLGPFIDAGAVRSILKVARKIFPFCTCSLPKGEVCLYFHLGLCRGHDEAYINSKEYQKDINGLIKLFSGKTKELEKTFNKEMKNAAKESRFEEAAEYRDKLRFLERIKKSHFISERDLRADDALLQLKNELNLVEIPKRIECFDISNIMGTSAVGSMVVFKNGIASPKDYRRFKIRTVKGANDYAMMAEVLARRFRFANASGARQPANRYSTLDAESQKAPNQNAKLNRNSKPARPAGGLETRSSELPDLVILDGGKGQLSAVLQNIIVPEGIKIVALSKRQEEIFSAVKSKSQASNNKQRPNSKLKIDKFTSNFKFQITNLPKQSEAMYLVQRIRDEAHRFAITYHRKVRSKEFFESSLDAIPGVGPKTKKKLLKEFGSIEKIKAASIDELSKTIPTKLAKKIKEQL
ncbi:excinuclease ABC subunit UvrC [Patescibacteria group bacterium]|nr:excinuclease ABC subunit UvrC [Patescibacteria group bacterium]